MTPLDVAASIDQDLRRNVYVADDQGLYYGRQATETNWEAGHVYWDSASTKFIIEAVQGGAGSYRDIGIKVGGNGIVDISAVDGKVTITQPAAASGSPTGFVFTGGAHSVLAAATEAIDVNFDLARTVTFGSGNIGTQRAFVVQAPTYSFVAPSTIAYAHTFHITGAPIAGANASLTAPYALYVASGNTYLGGTTRSASSIVMVDGQATFTRSSSGVVHEWNVTGIALARLAGLSGSRINLYTNGSLGFGTTGDPNMLTVQSGNVGVGLTAAYKFHVKSTSVGALLPLAGLWNAGGTTGTGAELLFQTGTGSNQYFASIASYNERSAGLTQDPALVFRTMNGTVGYSNLSEKMRLSSVGDLGIGTGIGVTPTYRLHVVDSAAGATVVWGHATDASGVSSTAGHFQSDATTGIGVSGYASDTGAASSGYGGHFIAAGGAGRGIFIQSTKAGAVTNYGAYIDVQGDTGYGIYSIANRNYFSGMVGIGTANPTYNFEILDTAGPVNTLIQSNGNAYHVIHAGADGSSANAYQLWQQNGGSTNFCVGFSSAANLTPCGSACTDALAWAFQVVGTSSDHVQLGAGAAIYITIRNGGNIGVHTNNPQAVLDIRGDIRADVTTAALGGGAAATLGTIGGSGPTVAGQNQWAKINISGTDYWLPVWV